MDIELSVGSMLLLAGGGCEVNSQVSNDDDTEVLVVEAKFDNTKIRLINGYGPQESDEDNSKAFMSRIDIEVKSAMLAGALICIEMDANSKLGQKIIKGDPRDISKNGKLLKQVVDENNLVVVNGTELCDGVLTRQRKTVDRNEESVLDFFIVCKNFFKLVKKMKVDEEKQYSLCSFSTRRGVTSIKNSDHNLIYLEIDRKWKTSEKKARIEIFNYNDEEGFDKFRKETEDNPVLKYAFEDESEDLEISSKKWLKEINSCIRKSFKKVRIGKYKTDDKLEALFHEKEYLMESLAKLENEDKIIDIENTKEKIDEVNEAIAKICSNKNKKIVDEHLKPQNDAIEGFSQAKTWKLKKKLAPKNTAEPPAAKKDKWGNIVTDKEALEALYIDTYKERLKPNTILDGLEELKGLKEYLFELRLKFAGRKVTNDWKMQDLEKVLKAFKNGKARD